MIQSADIETRLRRLGEELQKTNRRVNALENVVIPELEVQVKFIFSSLDERAREDHFRLKKVKKKIENEEASGCCRVARGCGPCARGNGAERDSAPFVAHLADGVVVTSLILERLLRTGPRRR